MKNWNWYALFSSETEANAQLPVGSTRLVKAGELEICLAHTEKGFFAVHNECSHSRAPLHKGVLNDLNEIICPLHQYRFSLQTGEETSEHNCPSLQTYPIEIREDGVFICLPF